LRHPATADRGSGRDRCLELPLRFGKLEDCSGACGRLHDGFEARRRDAANRTAAFRLCEEAGLPAGILNIVTGFGETAGAALASSTNVDKVCFTGSVDVGKKIVQAATSNLKRVTLELGGKSPNIVFADADLESTIPAAATAIFRNTGQVCCAGSRLYVERKVFDKVVEGIGVRAKEIKLGASVES